jgi:hypothetical protein
MTFFSRYKIEPVDTKRDITSVRSHDKMIHARCLGFFLDLSLSQESVDIYVIERAEYLVHDIYIRY